MNFQKYFGRTLLAGNLIVLSLLIYYTLAGATLTDSDMLAVTQVGLVLISFLIVYFVLKTWKTFKEKDLLVGLSGFILIFISYCLLLTFEIINSRGEAIEAGLNTLLAIGYFLIAVAVGWLK